MLIIEGNIGVGKSTFLRRIQTLWPAFEVVQEPVENWAKNNDGQSLLEQFYTHPNRWAYTLETLTMLSRVKEHIQNQKIENLYRLVERSIYSGHYCFAKNDLAQGFLNSVEWSVYQEWADFFINKQCTPPLGFIYLRAEPTTCYARIVQRSRTGEESISLEYLTQIHTWYEKFLVLKQDIEPRIAAVPTLVLDCNQDFENNEKAMHLHILNMQNFIEKIQSPLNFTNLKNNNEISLT